MLYEVITAPFPYPIPQGPVFQHFGIRDNEPGGRLAVSPIHAGQLGVPFFGGLPSPEQNRLDSPGLEAFPLIVHQGEQGIDHQRRSVKEKGRRLKAQGFSGPRGQKDDLAPPVNAVFVEQFVAFHGIAAFFRAPRNNFV